MQSGPLLSLALAMCVSASAQSGQSTPFVVTSVNVATPVDGLPYVTVSLRNTGKRSIEAWAVNVIIRLPNGKTQSRVYAVDDYETQVFAPSTSAVLAPDVVVTTRLGIQDEFLSTPGLSLSAMPVFAVFDDNSAVGDETQLALCFVRRQKKLQTWRLIQSSISASRATGLAGRALAEDVKQRILSSADADLRAGVAYVDTMEQLDRAVLAGVDSAAAVAQLESLVSRRRTLAEVHATRRDR